MGLILRLKYVIDISYIWLILIQFSKETATFLHKDKLDKDGNPAGSISMRWYWSFKLKCACLNTQVCVDADMWVTWISPESLPAGRYGNDTTMLQGERLEEFLQVKNVTN